MFMVSSLMNHPKIHGNFPRWFSPGSSAAPMAQQDLAEACRAIYDVAKARVANNARRAGWPGTFAVNWCNQ